MCRKEDRIFVKIFEQMLCLPLLKPFSHTNNYLCWSTTSLHSSLLFGNYLATAAIASASLIASLQYVRLQSGLPLSGSVLVAALYLNGTDQLATLTNTGAFLALLSLYLHYTLQYIGLESFASHVCL